MSVVCERLHPKRATIPQESIRIGCRLMRTWLKAIGKRLLPCTMMDGRANDSEDRLRMVLALAAQHHRQNVNTNHGTYVTEPSLASLELALPSIWCLDWSLGQAYRACGRTSTQPFWDRSVDLSEFRTLLASLALTRPTWGDHSILDSALAPVE